MNTGSTQDDWVYLEYMVGEPCRKGRSTPSSERSTATCICSVGGGYMDVGRLFSNAIALPALVRNQRQRVMAGALVPLDQAQSRMKSL